MEQIITLDNVEQVLTKDNVLQITNVYSYLSKKYWRICKEINIRLSNGEFIKIPVGFYTDLSSVPFWLWSIFRPYGDFTFAAVIHDYLYVTKKYSQEFSDKEMLIWSNKINRSKLNNKLRYFAVRLFGWTYWNRKTTTQREFNQ